MNLSTVPIWVIMIELSFLTPVIAIYCFKHM